MKWPSARFAWLYWSSAIRGFIDNTRIHSTAPRPTPMRKSMPLFCRFFPKANNLFVSDQELAIRKGEYLTVGGRGSLWQDVSYRAGNTGHRGVIDIRRRNCIFVMEYTIPGSRNSPKYYLRSHKDL